MTDTPHPPATVSTHATATVRLRPAVLVMVARGRAAAATLELGLAEVKRWAADAGRRLTRLGAARVAVGEPHPDDCADPDPMAGLRREARTRLPRTPDAPPADRPGVNVTLTATWDIAGSSAEEVLLLVDRLRFDAAVDAEPPAAPPAPPPGAGPEEQLRAMVAQMAELAMPPDDLSPKFLYVARPGDDLLGRATAEAYAAARRLAERLAHAAGRRLGGLHSLSSGPATDGRTDRVMERQRCAALLAVSAYDSQPGEVVSEDPRSVELSVSVHVTHRLD